MSSANDRGLIVCRQKRIHLRAIQVLRNADGVGVSDFLEKSVTKL